MLLILSGLALGSLQSQRLKTRKSALLDFQKFLFTLRTEIQYAARPMDELIRGHPGSIFCKRAAADPAFSEDPCGALKRAGEMILVQREDRQLFQGFIGELGISDTENQLAHIGLYQGFAAKQLQEAEEDLRNRSRLFVALGLFGGVTLSLLLI